MKKFIDFIFKRTQDQRKEYIKTLLNRIKIPLNSVETLQAHMVLTTNDLKVFNHLDEELANFYGHLNILAKLLKTLSHYIEMNQSRNEEIHADSLKILQSYPLELNDGKKFVLIKNQSLAFHNKNLDKIRKELEKLEENLQLMNLEFHDILKNFDQRYPLEKSQVSKAA